MLAQPSITQTVRITGSLKHYSEWVRSRLAETDTQHGVIVEVYDNPGVVAVRFPPLEPDLRAFDMDIPLADLEPVELEPAYEAALEHEWLVQQYEEAVYAGVQR